MTHVTLNTIDKKIFNLELLLDNAKNERKETLAQQYVGKYFTYSDRQECNNYLRILEVDIDNGGLKCILVTDGSEWLDISLTLWFGDVKILEEVDSKKFFTAIDSVFWKLHKYESATK